MVDDKDVIEADILDGDSEDITMKNESEVKSEELDYLEDIHNTNEDMSQSNGEEAGDEEQTLIGTEELYVEEDSKHPSIRASKVEEGGGLFEPSVITSALAPDFDGNRNELHIDLPIQPASVISSESFLEPQAGSKLTSNSNGMKLEQGIETMEEELDDEGPKMELVPKSETNDEASNEEMRLILESEIREEKPKVVTGIELPVDCDIKGELNMSATGEEQLDDNQRKEELPADELDKGGAAEEFNGFSGPFLLGPDATESEETGTAEEQAAFIRELEIFHKERCLDFKPPRFYQEPLNCLKLWRSVVRLGGYEQVTSCKLWRQVGEAFKPPKTCTTVSWTFRCFYEKVLLEYEKHKLRCGELPYTDASFMDHANVGTPLGVCQAPGSGRQRRDAAARAMQGWHSHRLLGNGEVGDPIIKDKNSSSNPKRERPLKSIGLLKRKKPSPVDRVVKVARMKASNPQSEAEVIDIGHPADWVKINVQRTKDCFEVYALVPGLLREEVRVQSDPVGRLVISGEPEELDNPWGVTPFKKVVSLPSRIDPHQTSAVVTVHGQLFVRVPYEPLDL